MTRNLTTHQEGEKQPWQSDWLFMSQSDVNGRVMFTQVAIWTNWSITVPTLPPVTWQLRQTVLPHSEICSKLYCAWHVGPRSIAFSLKVYMWQQVFKSFIFCFYWQVGGRNRPYKSYRLKNKWYIHNWSVEMKSKSANKNILQMTKRLQFVGSV